jgi:hypothetical protein
MKQEGRKSGKRTELGFAFSSLFGVAGGGGSFGS